MSAKDREILEHFAHFVWWEKKDEIIARNPLRIVASAMRDANSVESFKKVCEFSDEILKETLKNAESGWIDAKSWHFWHIRLYGVDSAIPPLPKRKFL